MADVVRCLRVHEIHILKTPEDTQMRMHPMFDERDTGRELSQYQINQAYHDHIEARMTPAQLAEKRRAQALHWRQLEEQVMLARGIERFPCHVI